MTSRAVDFLPMRRQSYAVMRAASRRVALSVAVLLFLLSVMTPDAAVAMNGTITVVAKEYKFTPNVIRVKVGQPVTIIYKDEGVLSHNLSIFTGPPPVRRWHTPTIQSGTQATLRFTAPKKAGIYAGWCTVPGHKQAGMTLRLIVERR